jgi:hypothetical protein
MISNSRMAPWHARPAGWLILLLKCTYDFQTAGWMAKKVYTSCPMKKL